MSGAMQRARPIDIVIDGFGTVLLGDALDDVTPVVHFEDMESVRQYFNTDSAVYVAAAAILAQLAPMPCDVPIDMISASLVGRGRRNSSSRGQDEGEVLTW